MGTEPLRAAFLSLAAILAGFADRPADFAAPPRVDQTRRFEPAPVPNRGTTSRVILRGGRGDGPRGDRFGRDLSAG